MEEKDSTQPEPTNVDDGSPPVVIPWGLQQRDLAPSSMKVS